MKYDKTSLTVKAGQPVELLFENKGDPQPHNFVLLKPGTRDAYGALSEKLILADPTGAAAQLYAPASPDVLAKGSKLIGISQTELIKFTAPSVPGDYPYICTFPAHWRLMNGVLKVTP
jgi:azurin